MVSQLMSRLMGSREGVSRMSKLLSTVVLFAQKWEKGQNLDLTLR